MSTQTRLLVVCGVLVAVTAASITALAMNVSRPVANNAPAVPQVLTLAASSTGNTITAIGVGQGSATPNQADLDLGVSATRPSVRDAINAAAGDMTHLLNAVHNQGVQDKDIQTTSIWVQTQTQCCPQTVIGYSAATHINVTLHSVNAATPLIEAAVDAVGNDLQINGISLSVADQSAMTKTARAAAMNDAKVRAQDYAQLSGHHLGGLIGVSEAISTSLGCMGCGPAKGGGGGIPISPGVTSVTVTVAVTFELAN